MEKTERQALADRQIVATFMAAGSKQHKTLPSVDEAKAALDAALCAEPSFQPVEETVLLEAMGVRRGG